MQFFSSKVHNLYFVRKRLIIAEHPSPNEDLMHVNSLFGLEFS